MIVTKCRIYFKLQLGTLNDVIPEGQNTLEMIKIEMINVPIYFINLVT